MNNNIFYNRCVLTLLLIISKITNISGQAWADITSQTGLNTTSNYIPITFDYNNDGWSDILTHSSINSRIAPGGWIATSQGYKLFKNNGNKKFSDVTSSVGLSGIDNGTFVSSDFDNDGDQDLIFCDYNQLPTTINEIKIFKNNSGVYTNASSELGVPLNVFNLTDTIICQPKSIDYDQDGDVDIVYILKNNRVGYVKVLVNNKLSNKHDFSIQKTIVSIPVANISNRNSSASFDFFDMDNDSDFDLVIDFTLVGSSSPGQEYGNGLMKLYRNQNSTYTDVSATSGLIPSQPNPVSVLDINNDGKLDIIKGAADCCTGQLYQVFLGSGTGTFTSANASYPIVGQGYKYVSTLNDFDNDGDFDFSWGSFTSTASAPFRLWKNNGSNNYTEIAATYGLNLGVASGGVPIKSEANATWIDIDNNGADDIIISKRGVDPRLWVMQNPITGNYLRVKLQRCGIDANTNGTRVMLKFGNKVRWLYSGVNGVSGNDRNRTDIFHFGLGNETKVDTLRVYWSTGEVKDYFPGINQLFSATINSSCSQISCNISDYNPFPNLSTYSKSDSLKIDAGIGYLRYRWSTGDSAQAIHAKYTGFYKVTVTNSSGCTASDSVFVQFPDTVGLHVSKVQGVCNRQVDVPLRATSFRHMLTLQGSVNWNASDLRLDSISGYGPASMGLNVGNFGMAQTSNGKLTFSWNNPSGKGLSLVDSTTISTMRFTVLGTSNRSIPVTITGTPTSLEFYDAALVNKSTILTAGDVNVTCEFTISGKVLTPTDRGIRNVGVKLSGGTSLLTTMTDSTGSYSFKIMPGTYTLTPSKIIEQNKTNGLSTLDIALIQAHILQKALFNSPYKTIAADANNSSTVTTADILFLRRLILGTDSTLPNNRIWAFVDGDQNFSNPISPFPFNSTKTLTNQSSDISHIFRGIKIGDVNYDRNPLLDQAPSGDTLHLFGVSSEREDGLVSLKVKSHAVNGLMGWQSTLHWDTRQLQFLGIQGCMANLGIGERWKEDGFITLSWNDPMAEGLNFTEGADWLEMTFRKTAEFNSSSLILTGQKLNTEAFNGQYQSMGVVMEPIPFRNNSLVGRFRVYPNPVSNHMNVEWKMEEGGKAVVRILDMRGRLLFSESGTYNKGINRLKINRSNVSIRSGNCLVQVEVEGVTSVTSVMMLDELRIP